MSKQLQRSIDSAQNLSPTEQIELIKAIFDNLLAQPFEKLNLIETVFQLLREAFYKIDRPHLSSSFWQPKTLQQHIQEQQVRPITNLDDLVVDFWPEEQSVDDFLDFTYEQRRIAQKET
jgi:hypothetical protein